MNIENLRIAAELLKLRDEAEKALVHSPDGFWFKPTTEGVFTFPDVKNAHANGDLVQQIQMKAWRYVQSSYKEFVKQYIVELDHQLGKLGIESRRMK
jgi:hypothetical protein